MPTASMHFSGPCRAVSSSSRSSTLSSSKLIVSAPPALRHAQALGHMVDRDDLLRAEQHRAADRELPHRPGAPDRDRVGGLDVALHRGLPAGREDVAEEQHLLVVSPSGTLTGATSAIRHAHVLGLAAGVAAGQVRVAEQARGGVAEQLVGHLLVAVRCARTPRSCRAGTARIRRSRS